MRRISIDTLGMTLSKGGSFTAAKRKRSSWYLTRPKFVTTCCLFGLLYLYLNLGSKTVYIPNSSDEYVQDETLTDILNSTLGFEKVFVLNLPFRTDRRDAMALSAAISNIKLEFVDGVTGDSIRESAYPPPDENIKLPAGIRGSWRTHMNALRRVVEQNLTTALIFEDDVDWDVRVRQNLQRFALASRFLSENNDILSSFPSKYPLEHRPNTETSETTFHILSDNGITEKLPSMPLSSVYERNLRYPRHQVHGQTSPYGDPSQWDVLWMGHCGAGFPRYSDSHRKTDITTANAILTLPNDKTVPVPKHLKAHPFQGDPDPFASAYPPHTRIYHRSTGGELCTVGYAVSQRGARRLLHQFGVKHWNDIFDSALGRWCAGQDGVTNPDVPKRDSKPQHPLLSKGVPRGNERVCLATQPPIFAHHHPENGESDIGGLGGGYARKYETKYLRHSVRMNLERIVRGEKELLDQWPDE